MTPVLLGETIFILKIILVSAHKYLTHSNISLKKNTKYKQRPPKHVKLIKFVDHFPKKKCGFHIHGAVAVVERLPL